MPPSTDYLAPDGKIWHGRMVKSKGWTTCHGLKRKTWTPNQCTPVKKLGKHRYLMPLDAEMRERVLPLAKPYPKRHKQAMAGDHPEQRQCNADHDAPNTDYGPPG
jgi:hypothetical protein